MRTRPSGVPLRVLAVILSTAGIGAVWLGWFGAAGYDWLPSQLPYLISGGLAGLGLVIAGVCLFLVDTIQRTTAWRAKELTELRRQVEHLLELTISGGADPPRDDREILAQLDFNGPDPLVLASRTTFHRPDCRYVHDREASMHRMRRGAAQHEGLSACQICQPARANEYQVPR